MLDTVEAPAIAQEDLGRALGKLVFPNYQPTYDEMAGHYPEEQRSLLDQDKVVLDGLTHDQRQWRERGVLIKRRMIDPACIDAYLALRAELNMGLKGFDAPHAYIQHKAIRDICCDFSVNDVLNEIMGEAMGLHFILSDFVSSNRGWHPDDYLNPEDVCARYCAVWFALDDIHADSGPFEYVPGSHRWPVLRREKVVEWIVPEERDHAKMVWPIYAESFVNRAVEQKIKDTGAKVEQFIARKGDVLFWHGALAHRGSIANVPGMMRPALIGHYSNLRSRRDFDNHISRHPHRGGYFWNFNLPVGG